MPEKGNYNIMYKRTLSIVAGAALVLAGALVVQPAAATDIPTGNAERECTAAGYDWGVKLDTGAAGTYVYDDIGPWEPDNLDVTLTVTINADGTFTWSNADPPVEAVLVKAGQGYTIIVDSDGGTTGMGASNGKDISHLTFCYGEPPNEPNEELTVTKTVNTSYTRDHDWSLEKTATPEHVYLYVPEVGPTTGSVDWKIKVGYLGQTDSAHVISGKVTVENTGETAAAIDELVDTMTIAGVPGPVALDCGAIDLTGTMVHILNVGQSFECTYSVPVSGEVSGTNMATASTLTGGVYSSSAMNITWGAPTTETNKTVKMMDVGDFGSADPVWFTAPNGGEVTYSNEFDWADYGKDHCGNHVYDNTATLKGDTIDLSDTASVTVHVQCYIFKGETAWAANTTAGTLPYNKKGGNWATYVQYPNTAPVVKVYNVYAGQTMLAGTATVTPIGGGMVTVTTDLTGNWEFADSTSNMKIQTYSSAPSGNPSPGQFTYKTTCTMDPCTSGPIPVAAFYGIHLDVGVWVPDPVFGP